MVGYSAVALKNMAFYLTKLSWRSRDIGLQTSLCRVCQISRMTNTVLVVLMPTRVLMIFLENNKENKHAYKYEKFIRIWKLIHCYMFFTSIFWIFLYHNPYALSLLYLF